MELDFNNFPHLIKNGILSKKQQAILSGMSIQITTPCYGGQCLAPFAKAVMDFRLEMQALGGRTEFSPLLNESLIQRGRNTLVALFLETDFEYLMFIDADINFQPKQLMELMLSAKLGKQRVVGASYPKKEFNISGIRKAIMEGKLPDDQIEHCSGNHTTRFLKPSQQIPYYELSPVLYLATGFLLIHRSVFTDMIKQNIVHKFRVNTFQRVESLNAYTWFDCPVDIHPTDDNQNELLSEDYYFCKQATKMEIPVMYAPWIELWHYGTYAFRGCAFCSTGNIIHSFETNESKTS